MLVPSMGHSSTLMMEETHSSERVTDFQQTTWHYIPEDRTLLHNHCCQTSNPTTLETDDGIRRRWSSGEMSKLGSIRVVIQVGTCVSLKSAWDGIWLNE
jgi:hypothetical protein